MLDDRARGQASKEYMDTIPIYCTLEGATEISPLLEGVAVGTLEACDMIQARTRNNVYEIFLLEPKSGRAIVRGGDQFPDPVEAIVCGSTFGGCMLKVGWLGVGFRMEISTNDRRAITSPIQSLRVERFELKADQVDSAPRQTLEAPASNAY